MRTATALLCGIRVGAGVDTLVGNIADYTRDGSVSAWALETAEAFDEIADVVTPSGRLDTAAWAGRSRSSCGSYPATSGPPVTIES